MWQLLWAVVLITLQCRKSLEVRLVGELQPWSSAKDIILRSPTSIDS